MTRQKAIEMVRRYGAAISQGRIADAAGYGMDLVEALMKVEDDGQAIRQEPRETV
jgi:hypothetical protein